MDKTSHAAGITHRLHAAVIVATAATILATVPVTAYQRLHLQASLTPVLKAAADDRLKDKDCFFADEDGRNWPCWRRVYPSANVTTFECPIENRLGAGIHVLCDDEDMVEHYLPPGGALYQSYVSVVLDRTPRPRFSAMMRTSPRVTCEWRCAGNRMTGLVLWDELWPEARSCRKQGGDGRCRVVFDGNREVVLATRAGRRVLGDVAVKECSKNLWGYGGWLPFGLGCTYPKHDHLYYGHIES
ncbi:hypothetical protein ACP70R_018097 [Stipagrostis hirtigluma subsp. patula]